ncbi:hypothetical protein FZEAL_1817 [Fusarium zealandicum]|uniref:Uncharacterized protein n=1 Tax=Fusarium zealandicum TaxID=1053134 RepID=A0A8H4XP56_9HYPO|nr:hypothetical protein FZEAL_1817 [Fusarium zealandicum]
MPLSDHDDLLSLVRETQDHIDDSDSDSESSYVLCDVKRHTTTIVQVSPSSHEPAQVAVVSPPGTGPHIHSPTCGCSWVQTFQQSQERSGVVHTMRVAERRGILESASSEAYNYSNPELPKYEPRHQTLQPLKSCMKKAAPFRGCDESDVEDANDDQKNEGQDNKSSEEQTMSVRFDNVSEATCILTGEQVPRAPKKARSALRWLFHKGKLLTNKAARAMSSSPHSSEDEDEAKASSGNWAAQDKEIKRRLERAIDYAEANERAAIIRGALDLLVYVSTLDSRHADLASCIVSRLGKGKVVGSYTSEEREFVNRGMANTSEIPEAMYRDKDTAMSWSQNRTRNGPHNVTRFANTESRDLPW